MSAGALRQFRYTLVYGKLCQFATGNVSAQTAKEALETVVGWLWLFSPLSYSSWCTTRTEGTLERVYANGDRLRIEVAMLAEE